MGSRILLRCSWIALVTLVSLGMPGGCQKELPTPPVTAQAARLVEFRASRRVLSPGDTTLLTATVLRGSEPGSPASGVEVVFGEVLDGQSGVFSKLQGTTATDGVATTVFRAAAGDSGLVTLKAGLANSTDYKYELLLVTRAVSTALVLTAEVAGGATGLPADGRSLLEITVTAVQGAARTPVPLLPLVLTAGDQFIDDNRNGIHDAGEPLVAAGDRNGNGTWDAQGTLAERVTTDAQGAAKVIYQAGADVGPVFIRVTTAPGASPTGASVEIPLLQHSLAHTVALTPRVRQLLADGVSQTAVTVLVTKWDGKPEAGVLVKLVAGEAFTDLDGDGYYTSSVDPYVDANKNGLWDASGTVSPSIVTTGDDGLASVNYRAGLQAGDFTLRASTTIGFSERVMNLVSGPPASRVTVQLSTDALNADDVSTATGTVEVTDLNGGRIAGRLVHLVAGEHFNDVDGDGRFTAGTDQLLGDVDGNQAWTAVGQIDGEVTTGADGRATFTYRAGLVPQPVWIVAGLEQVSAVASLTLRSLPAIHQLAVVSAAGELAVSEAGGLHRTQVSAVGYDEQGRAISAGFPITFSILSGPGGGESLEGAVSGQVVARTNANGTASATLLTGTLPGAVQIRATNGDQSGSTTVSLASGLAAFLVCSADSVSLEENSKCQIRAYVYDLAHNAVVDGTVVTFRADKGLVNTSGGLGQAETANGMAVATFTAVSNASGDYDPAEITVSHNGGSNGNLSCSMFIDMSRRTGGPDLAASLVCSADSVSLAENASCQVRAYVYDAAHDAVADGTVVTFSANKGILVTSGDQGQAQTRNGLALATFTAVANPAGETGPAEVTVAHGGGVNGDLSCVVLINTPQPPGAISQLTMDASPLEIAVAQTGETSQAMIRALGVDQQNRPVGPNRSVTFRITAGPGGGEHFYSAGDSVDVRTDAAGVAEVILQSGTRSGTVVVSARATESTQTTRTTAIGIAAGPPAFISIVPKWRNVACPEFTTFNPIITLVYDTYHNPVRDNTPVHFTTDIGMIQGDQGQGHSWTVRGSAAATWFPPGDCGSGLVTITASTAGETLTGSTTFLASGSPYSARFDPAPADSVEMEADGRSTEQFVVEVLDQNGQYSLPAPLEATAKYGWVPTGVMTGDGVNFSTATITYKAPVLGADEWYSIPDNGVGAVDTVRVHAMSGTVDDTLVVKLHTGSAAAARSSVDIAGTVPLGGMAVFSVTIKDTWGNPLGGHELALTTDAGTVTPTGTTDAGGTVSGLLFTAPSNGVMALIMVQDNDPNYGNLTLRKTVTLSGR